MREDMVSLMAARRVGRRSFVAGASAAAGFAVAAGAVAAETVIKTDTQGLKTGMEAVAVKGGNMPVYYAHPAAGGPFPTILVVHEVFGVHEYIKDTCRRLAKLGYMAVAPELFFRSGDPSKAADIPTVIRNFAAKASDAEMMSDLDAVAAWAAAGGKSDANRLAVTGYCFGGRITWLYAAHNPKLKAGVAWYGRLTGDYGPMTPKHPIDVAKDLKAPVLGLYGAADMGIPLSTIEDMKADLESAKVKTEFVVYPDAPHAFHADYRSNYREAPAKDGWARMHDWFKRHGV